MTLWKWLRQADIDDGATPGKTTGESAELRELRHRNRLLEQENEVLRRAVAYPVTVESAGKGFTRDFGFHRAIVGVYQQFREVIAGLAVVIHARRELGSTVVV